MKTSNDHISKMNALLGNTQHQENNTSRDTDIKNSRHQEKDKSSEQEIKRSKTKEVKKTKVRKVQSSGFQESKKSRVVNSNGITRRPENITIRVAYYRAIRLLAIEREMPPWRLIDEALGMYLATESKSLKETINPIQKNNKTQSKCK